MPAQTLPPALPLSFRGEIVPQLFRAIRGGWSCALVSLPGAGGSNLLRFLCEPRVVAGHLGRDPAQTLFIYLDAPPTADALALFQALAERALSAARAFGWPRAAQAAKRSQARRLPAAGAEALVDLFGYLCAGADRRVVLALDEADAAILGQPASALRALRRLRDEHKYALSFIVCTRRELAALAAERGDAPDGLSKFAELFDQHTFAIGPYNRQDAEDLLARKTTAWFDALTPAELDGLYHLTGGHAKMLVAALIALESRRHLPWPEAERGLLANPLLQEVCAEIWASLDAGEQAALRLLAAERGAEAAPADLAMVKLKGLAVGSPAVLFCDVFEAFVISQPPDPAAPHPARAWTSHLRDPLERAAW